MDRHRKYSRDRGHKRRRSRSRSWESRKRTSRSSTEERKLDYYKQELGRFLEEQANVKDQKDFWTFYDKYVAIQSSKKSDVDKNKLLNLRFAEKHDLLFDKLPVLDRRGEKVVLSRESFEEFLLTVRIYKDFQQKVNFAKLKKLKAAQNDLPIAQYKSNIIETLKNSRVVLIAGEFLSQVYLSF